MVRPVESQRGTQLTTTGRLAQRSRPQPGWLRITWRMFHRSENHSFGPVDKCECARGGGLGKGACDKAFQGARQNQPVGRAEQPVASVLPVGRPTPELARGDAVTGSRAAGQPARSSDRSAALVRFARVRVRKSHRRWRSIVQDDGNCCGDKWQVESLLRSRPSPRAHLANKPRRDSVAPAP